LVFYNEQRFDEPLNLADARFFCELTKLLSYNLCRSGFAPEMTDWDSQARRSASQGVIFSTMALSAYGYGSNVLKRYGIAREISDPDLYGPHEITIAADMIKPASLDIGVLTQRDLAEVLHASQIVLDQSCHAPGAEFLPTKNKLDIQKTGMSSGYLNAVPIPVDIAAKLRQHYYGADGSNIKTAYFWTSKVLGKPYDLNIEHQLPDPNFWQYIYPEIDPATFEPDESLFAQAAKYATTKRDDGMKDLEAMRKASTV